MLGEVERDRRRARGRPRARLGRRLGPADAADGRARARPARRCCGSPSDRPVVAVAGNHDSADLFEALAPLLRPTGRAPDRRRSSVPTPARCSAPTSSGCPRSSPGSRSCARAASSTSCAKPASGTARTRSKVAAITGRLQRGAGRRAPAPTAVPILMAHFMVGGVKIDAAAPRGERELHMGDAYAATAQAIPAGPQYVAMGHIHAPQAVPGAPVPAQYAGSLLCARLRRGGRAEARRGRRRRARPAGDDRERAARRAAAAGARHRDWDADRGSRRRAARTPSSTSRCTTRGTDLTLAERARETFPYLVKVRALAARAASGRSDS